MGKVSNRFFIQSIKDGSSVSAYMVGNPTLTQRINGDICTPNWNEWQSGAVCPVVHVYSTLDGKPKASNGDWYYNGTQISWQLISGEYVSSNFKTVVDGQNKYWFKQTTVSVTVGTTTVAFPAIRITHNLAGVDQSGNLNSDNDVIRYDGRVDVDISQIDFSVSQVVRISELSSAGYVGVIGGATSIAEKNQTVCVYAQLFGNSAEAVQCTTKWYRESIDADGIENAWNTGQYTASETTQYGITVPAKSSYIAIQEGDITDYVVLRCDFYDSNNQYLCSEWYPLDDRSDEEVMFIEIHGTLVNAQEWFRIRKDQTVNVHVWMATLTNPYTEYAKGTAKYNLFKCKLTKADNSVITSGGPIPSGATITDGFFDITVSNQSIPDTSPTFTPTKSGKLTGIAYDFVNDTCGGGLTGYLTAEMTTT